MKSFEKDLQKYAEKIRLKVSERHELRERILSYMEYHPLPKQGLSRAELESVIHSEPFITFNFSWQYARIAGGVFALFVILAPFVAERAMPGDVLYLVKTGINENIQKQLVDSPYEKIEFETKIMERRISEARTLASEGKLTEEVKTQIAEDVKKSTKAVQSGIEELKASDAEGAAIAQIAFNSKLEVQSAVLDAERDTEDTELIAAVQGVVEEARVEVATSQAENKPSFEGLMAQVEIETTRAYELFTTVKESATAEEIADIERRLSDINRIIGDTKIAYENQNAEPVLAAKVAEPEEGTEAVTMMAVATEPVADVALMTASEPVPVSNPADDLANTLGLIQKLIVFMTDIDVRETVELETLVPVVLSEEERAAAAMAEVEAIGGIAAKVTERLGTIGDVGAKDHIIEALARVEELTNAAVLALKDGNVAEAETALTEARAFVTDADVLSQHEGIKIPEEEILEPVIEDVEATSATGTVATTAPEAIPETPQTPELY